MRLGLLFVIPLILFSCVRPEQPAVPAKQPVQIQGETVSPKELDEIKKTLKGDIKIKLKKDGKGAYSWEISGRDAQEILKVNDSLRKRLNE